MNECYCQFKPYLENGEDNPDCSIIPKKYVGNGTFRCPECGEEENHSDVIYKVWIQYIRFDDDSGNDLHIIEPITDKRLLVKEENWWGTMKEILEEYLTQSQDEFVHKHEVGIFDCEILFFDYRCSYEYEEYETIYEMLNEVEVNERDGRRV